MLHNDITATSLYIDKHVSGIAGYFLNMHVALTDIDHDSSGVTIYPETHKQILNPVRAYLEAKALNLLDTQGREEVMMNIALSAGVNWKAGTEARHGESHIYGAGMCSTFHYLQHHFKEKDIEGFIYQVKAGDFLLFDPVLLHGSSSTNQNDHARISLVITFVKQPKVPFGVEYLIMNNKFYIKDFINLFTSYMENISHEMLYEKSDLTEMLSYNYSILPNQVESCMTQYGLNSDTYTYVNTLDDSNPYSFTLSVVELQSLLYDLNEHNCLSHE